MDTTRTTLSCGGHAWPAVATGEVGAIGRALERAQPDTRVKITSGTLNVAGTGPLAGIFARPCSAFIVVVPTAQRSGIVQVRRGAIEAVQVDSGARLRGTMVRLQSERASNERDSVTA